MFGVVVSARAALVLVTLLKTDRRLAYIYISISGNLVEVAIEIGSMVGNA